MKDAREENPDDLGLLLSEANVHLKWVIEINLKTLWKKLLKKILIMQSYNII